LNPLLFVLLEKFGPGVEPEKAAAANRLDAHPDPDFVTKQQGHIVLIGFGRVGSIVGNRLIERSEPILVIDDNEETVAKLRARNVEALAANGVTSVASANLTAAKQLIVSIPDCFEAGQIVAQARAANADLVIIARAHSDVEEKYLKRYGATQTVQAAKETAEAMLATVDASKVNGANER
jgi:monovalent cation:H+ antiporter-2, CPA2 family